MGNCTWEVEKHDFGKKVFAFVEIDFHVAIEPPRETLTGMQWRSYTLKSARGLTRGAWRDFKTVISKLKELSHAFEIVSRGCGTSDRSSHPCDDVSARISAMGRLGMGRSGSSSRRNWWRCYSGVDLPVVGSGYYGYGYPAYSYGYGPGYYGAGYGYGYGGYGYDYGPTVSYELKYGPGYWSGAYASAAGARVMHRRTTACVAR